MSEACLIEMTNKYNILKNKYDKLLLKLREKDETLEELNKELKFYKTCVPTLSRELKDVCAQLCHEN